MNSKLSTRNSKLAFLAACLILPSLRAQDTAFTYQGRLAEGTNVVNGIFDLRFAICDSSTPGTGERGSVTNNAVLVTNGLFTVTLDFGAAAFDGSARWLDIGVRTNGSAADYVSLVPRQPVTPTPYAIHARNAGMLGGVVGTNYAPATGSAEYVSKRGDTMTGSLEVTDHIRLGGTIYPGMWRAEVISADNRSGNTFISRLSQNYVMNTDNDTSYAFFRWYNAAGAPIESVDLTALTPLMVLNAGGNVGIGTTTPAAKLHVAGGTAIFDHPNGAIRTTQIEGQLNSDDLGIWVRGVAGNQPFAIADWGTGTRGIFVNTSSGNVGIGESSPQSRLTISSANSPNVYPGQAATLLSSATAVGDKLGIAFSQTGVEIRARAGIYAISEHANGYASSLGFFTRSALASIST